MIVEIKAKFSCDECGTEFLVSMDPATDPPAGWSVFDLAEDAIRAGHDYEDGHEPQSDWIGSVEGDRHLCGKCTRKSDQEEQPTPSNER